MRERQQRLDEVEQALITHDAQDGEGRRERNLRENEDTGERIFLDNEDRSEFETVQRGDVLFNALEDRIVNIPPIQVPPLPFP